MRIAVSLGSIPPRFHLIGPTLESLLEQTFVPEAIFLSIPRTYRRFPDWDGRLPDVPAGITILRPETDYGPATKLLPALSHVKGEDIRILICDDDQTFAPTWVEEFRSAAAEHPACCIVGLGSSIPKWLGTPSRNARLPRMERWGPPRTPTMREDYLSRGLRSDMVRVSGYVDLLLGYRGALIRPDFFDDTVFQIPPVLWAHDDIWFSGLLEHRRVPIWADARITPSRKREDVHEVTPLLTAVVDGMDRADLNQAGVDYFRRQYGIWRPPLTYRLRKASHTIPSPLRGLLVTFYRRSNSRRGKKQKT